VNNKNVFALSALLLATPCIDAAEGGSSSYLQGAAGDFAAGMLGPKGLYLRNDFIYYDASVPLPALGAPVGGRLSQALWGDLLKIAYISDFKILGGTYNANAAIPYLVGSEAVSYRDGAAPRVPYGDNANGLGDILFTPFALGWNFGRHHINANLSFYAPTGEYEDARVINPGRNYWSADPNINYTWMHPDRGHEFTTTIGYLHNWENGDSRYTTGDEVHIDWLLAQHLSAKFALGVTGYYYQQVTDDSGEIPQGFTAKDFDAGGAGVGVAAMYSPTIAGKNVSVVGKWITDTTDDNRLSGDVFFLGFSLKL
jgi:hypothetical protein